MKQKRHITEEIIRILREVDSSKNVEAACREHNSTATSYYRWKKQYGGTELQDARRDRELGGKIPNSRSWLADQMQKTGHWKS